MEGVDGAGKETQTIKLCEALRNADYDVLQVDFPRYNTNLFGKIIGKYLKGEFGDPTQIDPTISSFLYAGDRLEHCDRIKTHIKNGGVVVANRYVQSNIAYNVAKQSKDSAKQTLATYIEKLEYDTNELPKANVVIYLDLPIEVSAKLLAKKKEREYLKDDDTLDQDDAGEESSVEDGVLQLDIDEPVTGGVDEDVISLDLDELNNSDYSPDEDITKAVSMVITPNSLTPSLDDDVSEVVLDEYEKNKDYQRKVRQEYLSLSADRTEVWSRIECVDEDLETLLGIETIHSRVWNSVCKKLVEQLHKKQDLEQSNISNDKPIVTDANNDSVTNAEHIAKRLIAQRNAHQFRKASGFGRNNITPRQKQQMDEAARIKRQKEMLKRMNISKKEREKEEANNRKNQLLRRVQHLKRGRPNVENTKKPVSEDKHRTSIPLKAQSNVPLKTQPEPQSPKLKVALKTSSESKKYVLSLDVVERTRKTEGLVNMIFGSSEYIKDVYYFFLQKYDYSLLPKELQLCFMSLMRHYFSEDVTLYQEDDGIKTYLYDAIDNPKGNWLSKLSTLYHQYRIAIGKIDPNRKWFPEEIILITNIFKYRIRFGEKEFTPSKLDSTRLSSIYVMKGPLRQKYMKVHKYLRANNTGTKGIIQLNL
jgi:dTMP kinase